MVTPINVHEVMAALHRFPEQANVLIWCDHWRLRNDAGNQICSGETAAELRQALEKRTVPTAEEALAALDTLTLGNNPTRDWIADGVRKARRFIEAHKEQPDG